MHCCITFDSVYTYRDCLMKGLSYVLSIQKSDGPWEG